MAIKEIGSRVIITKGLSMFLGQKGTIIDNTERDGRRVMYRVKLDSPVNAYGVTVTDGLWDSTGLAKRATFSHLGHVRVK